jgi:alcohol dehydrogenase
MSGVQLLGHGGPEMLEWSDNIPLPPPAPGTALVRVLAAGVNATDINTRVGWYAREGSDGGGWGGTIAFPRIQGSDLCGRVVALADGVASPALGALVICPTNQPEPAPDNPVRFLSIGSEYDGAFAAFARVPARHLYDVSISPLSPVEIGAMPCAYGTALNLLTRAHVASGARVLVTGASGGVGLAAVQLAASLGAEVSGQCSAAKVPPVRAAGASATLDRDAAPRRAAFDAVIDVIGGPGWGDRIAALRPGGHYAVSGAIAGPLVEADLRSIYLGDLTLHGCTFQPPEVFARLAQIIRDGAVRPLVSRVYALRDIAAAQADLAAGQFPGKLVLVPEANGVAAA